MLDSAMSEAGDNWPPVSMITTKGEKGSGFCVDKSSGKRLRSPHGCFSMRHSEKKKRRNWEAGPQLLHVKTGEPLRPLVVGVDLTTDPELLYMRRTRLG